jgi:integrase
MNSQTVNAALKRAGLGGVLVSHGLRSIASTALNEQGFPPDVIEAALAHVDKMKYVALIIAAIILSNDAQ